MERRFRKAKGKRLFEAQLTLVPLHEELQKQLLELGAADRVCRPYCDR
jgi:hypothetical protein